MNVSPRMIFIRPFHGWAGDVFFKVLSRVDKMIK